MSPAPVQGGFLKKRGKRIIILLSIILLCTPTWEKWMIPLKTTRSAESIVALVHHSGNTIFQRLLHVHYSVHAEDHRLR